MRAGSDPLAPLTREFYLRPTAEVARDLLGRYLVLETPDQPPRIGQLVETEAYLGEADRACHAWHGRTPRTAPMYEEPGRAYIYFVYGMYWCLNAVTEPAGTPCAVLLRAAAPVEGLTPSVVDGPGKLCRAYGLDGTWNRSDLVTGPLRITAGQPVTPAQVGTSARIGVNYAGEWAEHPLRYFVVGSPHVSKRPSGRATDATPPSPRTLDAR